jgi:hypothetical protein
LASRSAPPRSFWFFSALTTHDGRQDEGRDRAQDGQHGVLVAPAAAQFDAAFEQHVQEVDLVALHEQRGPSRESLQEGAGRHVAEHVVGDAVERRQRPDAFQIDASHRHAPRPTPRRAGASMI